MNNFQYKTKKMEENSAQVCLKLNAKKNKVLKVNSKSEASLNTRNTEVEEMHSFTYLGTNVTKEGIGTADTRKRIAMAGASFRRLDNI